MKRKHLIALADDIRCHNTAAQLSRQYTPFTDDQIKMLAQYCENQNPEFNRKLWLDYVAGKCGPKGEKHTTIKSESYHNALSYLNSKARNK